jgi:hypothetical protein
LTKPGTNIGSGGGGITCGASNTVGVEWAALRGTAYCLEHYRRRKEIEELDEQVSTVVEESL